ncbi:TetR/AcrR family transcriptional regulator [Micromonospora sp. NPDC048871]|uniref:TetR/AcrR family transcriptional regulator n=1 Tax=unclassified Micromonospora TaxID=2617518 RepID=UPI0033FD6E37
MRVDKARNRDMVLAAAARLFHEATHPDEVSMDAVAAAAGVGKGTIFRGFGDRRGLLLALYQEHIDRELTAPVAEETPAQTALELLTRTWRFKQRHRILTLALEREGSGSPYQNSGYTQLHAQLTDLVGQARGTDNAAFLAHALIAAVRSDLIEHLRNHPEIDAEAGLRELVYDVLG